MLNVQASPVIHNALANNAFLNHHHTKSSAVTVHLEASSRCYTTEDFAAMLGLEPQSVRKRYSQTGSYYGLKPLKLPNRRLFWPEDGIKTFFAQDVMSGGDDE